MISWFVCEQALPFSQPRFHVKLGRCRCCVCESLLTRTTDSPYGQIAHCQITNRISIQHNRQQKAPSNSRRNCTVNLDFLYPVLHDQAILPSSWSPTRRHCTLDSMCNQRHHIMVQTTPRVSACMHPTPVMFIRVD